MTVEDRISAVEKRITALEQQQCIDCEILKAIDKVPPDTEPKYSPAFEEMVVGIGEALCKENTKAENFDAQIMPALDKKTERNAICQKE